MKMPEQLEALADELAVFASGFSGKADALLSHTIANLREIAATMRAGRLDCSSVIEQCAQLSDEKYIAFARSDLSVLVNAIADAAVLAALGEKK